MAQLSIYFGIISTFLVMGIAFYLPENFNFVGFAGIYCGLIKLYAEGKMGNEYKEHISNGGAKAPQWHWLLTGILSLITYMALAFALAYLIVFFAPELLPEQLLEQ